MVCADGYVAPARHGEHTLGASFDFHSQDLAPTAAEHASNLALLQAISPDLAQRLGAAELDPTRLQGRAAFRCTSPDYLPIVGPLADPGAFADTYAVLAKDARQVPAIDCPWLDGLYVNTGHGSRALRLAQAHSWEVTALSAERHSSLITDRSKTLLIHLGQFLKVPHSVP